MRNKITEEIVEISGIYTIPFRRYAGKIPLDELIDILKDEKTKSEMNGYRNLKLLIQCDGGYVDISIHGERNLTNEEKKRDEIIDVIFRNKEKTSNGLNRQKLLKNTK